MEIRRATPADKRAVKGICARIWSDDYLPEMFDDWVRDRSGGLWVACVDGRPVGVAKLTVIGDREAWLHALRVHPRFRRRGIAAALIAHRLDRARRLGVRVARLDTSSDNVAIRRLMRRLGFHVVGRYTFWKRPARRGESPRRATSDELATLWRLSRQGDGMLHELRVRRRLRRADLAKDVRAGCCFVADVAGEPLAMAIVEPFEDRLRLRHLAGRGRALAALLRSLPAEAARIGKVRIGMTADAPRWRALRAAGYRRGWPNEMLVFEKRLARR